MSIKVRERDVESYLVRKLGEIGLPCIKFVPDGKVGMPDRIVLLPGGYVHWVELKTDNGRLEEIQKLQHRKLELQGHRVSVIWNRDQVDQLVERLALSRSDRENKKEPG